MLIDILSLFPEYFSGPFDHSILKRARDKGHLDIHHHDLREFALDKHRKVDDRPFGGGPGMVIKPDVGCKAIRSVKKENSRSIYLSPQGKPLTASKCEELALEDHLILFCGHYEGIDERIVESEIMEEISIGDYILTNGCISAIVLIDAVSRFIPGVLGHDEAATRDTFSDGIFSGPQYTRPPEFEHLKVPELLLNGHHAQIEKWRKEKGLNKTEKIRPDLYRAWLEKKELEL